MTAASADAHPARSRSLPIAAAARAPRWFLPARIATSVAFASAIPLILGIDIGRRLFWTVAIALLPLFFTAAGFHLWRRICPLALVGRLGEALGRAPARRVGPWLAAHYLQVQLGILVVALALRLVATNGTPIALAGFLVLITLAAATTSLLYTGKTWCNYLCPVGVVEKLYTEPTGLASTGANSQCSTCTACKKHCPDIDLEAGYWKEASSDARRTVYFAWPGIVVGFYSYFRLCSGGWSYYFSGDWTRETDQAAGLFDAGFAFAPIVPRLIAAPVTLIAFGAASFLLFALGERLARRLASRGAVPDAATDARIRHRALVLAGGLGFLLFYLFAGQPTLAGLPFWVRRAFEALVVAVGTLVFWRRFRRSEADFVEEKFARGILKRWEWGDAPTTDDLSDVVLLHTERSRHREQRVAAFKDTLRELVADGVVSASDLRVLDRLRAQLGITDKEHFKALSELGDEDKRLFDPEYRGSIERRLQREQYRRDLVRVVLGAAGRGEPPTSAELDAVRAEHKVAIEEHAAELKTLLADGGALAARFADEAVAIARLGEAVRATRSGDRAESSRAVDFFGHVAMLEARRRLASALACVPIPVDQRAWDAGALFDNASPAAERERTRLAEREPLASEQLMRALATWRADATAAPSESDALLTCAGPGTPYLRASALYLLARRDDEPARAATIGGANDPAPLVRETVYRALGARMRLTRELVRQALDDADERVRRTMRQLLGQFGDDDAPAQTLGGRGTTNPAQYATLDIRLGMDAMTLLEELMLLHGVPLFATLEPDDLEALARLARERSWALGEELCREGESGDDVFVLVEGRVRAWVRDSGGAQRTLGESTPGSCIGEMGAIDASPRSATVTAEQPTRALVLGGADFRQLCRDRPAIAENVMTVLTRRLRGLIAQAQQPAQAEPIK